MYIKSGQAGRSVDFPFTIQVLMCLRTAYGDNDDTQLLYEYKNFNYEQLTDA